MLTLIGAVGVTIVLAVISWLLVRSHNRQRRMNVVLEDLSLRLMTLPAAPSLPVGEDSIAPGNGRDVVLDGLKGDRAPGFSIPDADGHPVSLDALRALGNPVLLFFTEPRCGPCYELLPDIAGWQRVYGDRLTIALISAGDLATNQSMAAEYGIERVLVQREMEVVLAYNLAQAPAAVLVSPEGIIEGGPRYGLWASRSLVAESLGLELPPAPIRTIRKLSRGDLAPALRLPDLNGRLVDLRTYQGHPTLLLFWNPGCGFCQQLLPQALAFEQLALRPDVVVISRGPYTLNADLGFQSPVVIDESRVIGQSLGVTGTPAAVVIDAQGRVATQVARGVDQVRVLLGVSATSFLAAGEIGAVTDSPALA